MTQTGTRAGTSDVGSGSRRLEGRSLRLVILLLAIACGASVANLYYAQPLLGLIRASFGISSGSAALVVTVTQVGYAAGLALLTPLGDLLENRKLASRTLAVTAVALLAAAVAPNFGAFLVAAAFIGVTSVVAQVLIPLAAHLAPAGSHGKRVWRRLHGGIANAGAYQLWLSAVGLQPQDNTLGTAAYHQFLVTVWHPRTWTQLPNPFWLARRELPASAYGLFGNMSRPLPAWQYITYTILLFAGLC